MKRLIFLLVFFSFSSALLSQSKDTGTWISHTIKKGEFAAKIFSAYDLWNEMDQNKFWELNSIKNKDVLLINKKYLIPIKQFKHNAPSIRSTLGFNDYDHALAIQIWNEKMERKGVKTQTLKTTKTLWVRFSDLPQNFTQKPQQENSVKALIDVRLFGTEGDQISIVDTSLKGSCFYLISGHGGPDPGSNITVDGHFLTEDEYAYDVTLRLARELVKRSARVFMIVQDFSHGIRDEVYLKHDKNEKLIGGITMPLNQIKRLKQRTDAVNRLYAENRNKYTYHRCIEIHVDSRSQNEQIDVFFYNYKGSTLGKRLNENMLSTFKKKYDIFQKGRGYKGEILTRNLYSLANTNPVMSYIELGNIQHARDRKRILEVENRQALAEWMAEGIEKDKKS